MFLSPSFPTSDCTTCPRVCVHCLPKLILGLYVRSRQRKPSKNKDGYNPVQSEGSKVAVWWSCAGDGDMWWVLLSMRLSAMLLGWVYWKWPWWLLQTAGDLMTPQEPRHPRFPLLMLFWGTPSPLPHTHTHMRTHTLPFTPQWPFPLPCHSSDSKRVFNERCRCVDVEMSFATQI